MKVVVPSLTIHKKTSEVELASHLVTAQHLAIAQPYLVSSQACSNLSISVTKQLSFDHEVGDIKYFGAQHLELIICIIISITIIIFWFSFLGIRLFRLNSTATFFKIFSGHLILSSFLFIPVLLDTEFHSLKLEIPSSEGIPLYTLVSYFVIPIVLIFANYLAHRIDPYEILIKFWHVYLLMITEFILLFCSINLGWGIHADILENRIPLFFLHFYYYVPFV